MGLNKENLLHIDEKVFIIIYSRVRVGGLQLSNIALRKIFAMLVEKLARLEIFLEDKKETYDRPNLKFVISCEESLKEIKQDLLTIYPVLAKTFEGKVVSAEETQKALEVYKKCLDKFLELHSLSSHLPLNPIASETYIFLSDVLKIKKTFKEFDSRIVLLTQDFLTRNTHQCYTNLPFVSDIEKKPMALYLPIIENSNPLYWPILVKNIFGNIDSLKASAKKHYEELIGQKASLGQEKRKILEKIALQLTYDIYSMKLLGPAYYYLFVEAGVFRSIAETRIRYQPTLAAREQILFSELERQNFAAIAESTHKWFITLSELSDEMHSTLGFKVDFSDVQPAMDEIVARLTREAESVIPEKYLFKCSDFCVSLAGFERLKKGILVASSTIEELNKSKKQCKEALCEVNFTEKTEKLQELPNTPQQIINAGWIYSEYVYDDLLREVLKSPQLDYTPFIKHIKNNDTLLLNSVEKSRIFEILMKKEG